MLQREGNADERARANLVPDAHLATLLRKHGVSNLYIHNVDNFEKFGFLDVRNPLTLAL